MGFVNGGYEILLYKYLWVATSPCGGFEEKFRNKKCSRSDSMTILGLLRVTLCSESNIFNEPHLIFSRAFRETIRMTFGVCVCECVCVSRAYHLVLLDGF